ncbi:MAG: hypothetical protein K0R18_490 [Bacillales bacterium]|nr:hypothetical protein [Bacillales bacterium]
MSEIDVYCKDNKCPICENDLIHLSDLSAYCENKCYEIHMDGEERVYAISVFYDRDNEDETYFSIKKQMVKIIEKIEYWKENDRYLMRILVGE